MRVSTIGCALSILAVAALPVVAWAGDGPGAPSTSLFEEGRKLLEQGQYVEACDRFKRSWDEDNAPGKAFNLSVCEEHQGHLRRAQEWMREGVLRLSPGDDRLAGAVEREQSLVKRLPHVRVVLDPSVPPDVAPIPLVDGQPVALGAVVPIDPGHHAITLTLEGHDPEKVEFELVEGERRDVPVKLGKKTPASAPKEPPTVIAPPVDEDRGARQRVAGFVVGGIGVAALGATLALAFVANANAADFEEAKAAGRPTGDIASRGLTINAIEGTFLGVGAAAVVTGLIVVLTAPRASRPAKTDTATLQLGVSPHHRGGSAWLTGTF